MASSYPSTVATMTNPLPSQRLNNPSHSSIESSQNDEIRQIQTFVGTTSSAVGTLVYDIRSANSNGGGHVQTAALGGTGQTTYTKGDILIAQNSSTLTKLAVGNTGQVLTADSSVATGVKWGAGAAPTIRTYTSGGVGSGGSSFLGIWYKPSNLGYAIIEVVSGGGGGKNVSGDDHGAGGGGGGFSRKVVNASSLPLAVSVICGRGGPSSVAGGTSRFGSVISVPGGSAGTQTVPGDGGLGSDGDINIRGGDGDAGNGNSTTDQTGGRGGDSFYGFGGGAVQANSAGRNGVLYGGGGGGAARDTAGSSDGGNGADGIIIVYEY